MKKECPFKGRNRKQHPVYDDKVIVPVCKKRHTKCVGESRCPIVQEQKAIIKRQLKK